MEDVINQVDDIAAACLDLNGVYFAERNRSHHFFFVVTRAEKAPLRSRSRRSLLDLFIL